MQVTVNNRRVKIGGRIVQFKKSELLSFVVEGDRFPYSYDTPYDSNMQLYVLTTGTNEITIDYGDGVVDVVTFSGVFSKTGGNAHIYADSNTGKRTITIKIKYPELIVEFRMRRFQVYGVFPSNILNLTNLKTLYLQTNRSISIFPEELGGLQFLEALILTNVGTAISQRLPNSILTLPNLRILRVGASVDMSDVYSSNLFGLCDSILANTLEELQILGNNITTLPPNFGNLKIKSLSIGQNNYSTLPPQVNDVLTLTHITIDFQGTLQYIGDIGQLVNLEVLSINRGSNLQPDLPINLRNCINLKTLSITNAFSNQSRTDTCIDNLYNFITSEASTTIGNTKFRQMTNSIENTFYSLTPSGTYQQPSGYSQGISNGTPASPLEKIWVMVKQYQHTWIY